MGRHPHRGRSRWNPGHTGAIRDAAPVGAPGDVRRPQRGRHPVDRPRLWKGWLSRVPHPGCSGGGWALAGTRWRSLPPRSVLTAYSLRSRSLSPEFLPGILTSDDKASLLLFGIAVGAYGGGFLEELGWTGFAVPTLLGALRCPYYGAHRGGAVGSVALPCELLGKRHFLRSVLPGHLPASDSSSTVGVLPAYRVLMVWVYDRTVEPARGDAHARESHSQHADPRSSGDRGGPLDL